MRNPEDRSGPLITCTGNTGRSPVLTGELVPVDWHGLPVQVTKGPVRSSGFLNLQCEHYTCNSIVTFVYNVLLLCLILFENIFETFSDLV